MSPRHRGAAVAGQAELAAAVAVLAATDLDSLSSEASLEALRGLWPLICAAQAQVARRVERIHTAGFVKDDGAVSTPAWLRTRLRVGSGAATSLVKAGAGLGGLTDTRAALALGETVLSRISELVEEEHRLRRSLAAGELSTEEEHARLRVLEESLDQCSLAHLRNLIAAAIPAGTAGASASSSTAGAVNWAS